MASPKLTIKLKNLTLKMVIIDIFVKYSKRQNIGTYHKIIFNANMN